MRATLGGILFAVVFSGCGDPLGPSVINKSSDIIVCIPSNSATAKKFDGIEVEPGEEVAVPEAEPRGDKKTRADGVSCSVKGNPKQTPNYKALFTRHPTGDQDGMALVTGMNIITGMIRDPIASGWFRWPLE